MTLALIEALRRVAHWQIAHLNRVGSTLGSDVAAQMLAAYQSVLDALDEEPIDVSKPKKK